LHHCMDPRLRGGDKKGLPFSSLPVIPPEYFFSICGVFSANAGIHSLSSIRHSRRIPSFPPSISFQYPRALYSHARGVVRGALGAGGNPFLIYGILMDGSMACNAARIAFASWLRAASSRASTAGRSTTSSATWITFKEGLRLRC